MHTNSTDKMAAIREVLEQLLHRQHFLIVDPSSSNDIPRYLFSNNSFLQYLDTLIPPAIADTPSPALPKQCLTRSKYHTLLPTIQKTTTPEPSKKHPPSDTDNSNITSPESSPEQEHSTPTPVYENHSEESSNESSLGSLSGSLIGSSVHIPTDLKTRLAAEFATHHQKTTNSTQTTGLPPATNQQPTSIDTQIAEYEGAFDQIDNKLKSITNTLKEKSSATATSPVTDLNIISATKVNMFAWQASHVNINTVILTKVMI
eukprot:jgi/Psemu1/286702/fgenesh1_pg.149_\